MQINNAYRIIAIGKISYSDEFKRFCRFLVIGAIGTTLDIGLLMVLKSTGMSTLIANAFSFSGGMLNNFVLNRTWTFKVGQIADWQSQLIQSTAVSLVGLLLNSILIIELEAPLGIWLNQPEVGYLPAKALATGLVLFWNYFANKFWTFRDARQVQTKETE